MIYGQTRILSLTSIDGLEHESTRDQRGHKRTSDSIPRGMANTPALSNGGEPTIPYSLPFTSHLEGTKGWKDEFLGDHTGGFVVSLHLEMHRLCLLTRPHLACL